MNSLLYSNIETMYQLSIDALKKINDLRPGIVSRLAIALRKSDSSIERFIKANEPDGDLTKLAAEDVFLEELGMIKEDIYTKVTLTSNKVRGKDSVVSTE